MPWDYEFTSPWMDNLPYDWSIFNGRGQIHHFEKDNYVFNIGDCLEYVYIVLKGRIRTFLNTADGKEKTLIVIGRNGLLGEQFIQGEQILSMSAIAVTESTLLKIDKKIFSEVAYSEKAILTQWLKILSLKTEVLTQSYSNLSFNNTKRRLARSLIYLAKTYGENSTNDCITIGIKFTHQELADFIGSSRVTVSNEMNWLQTEKVISRVDGYYQIPSISKLKDIYASGE